MLQRDGALFLLDEDLVLIGEDERMGLELHALCGLAALPGDGVGAEDAHVLDELGAGKLLQQREDLPGVQVAAEGPALAVRAACERVDELEQRVERLRLEA